MLHRDTTSRRRPSDPCDPAAAIAGPAINRRQEAPLLVALIDLAIFVTLALFVLCFLGVVGGCGLGASVNVFHRAAEAPHLFPFF